MSMTHGALTQTPPTQLYHYTSFAGLLGIARSKAIWASSIHHLNDEQEFAHGLQVMQQVIRDARDRNDQARRHDLRELFNTLEARIESIGGVNIFVASFSEMDDLLSQWRGYCPSGKGVSVGFFSYDLSVAGHEQGFRLLRVVYELSIQRMIAQELLDDAVKLFEESPTECEDIGLWFRNMLGSLAPMLKHPTFAEEREWRLVSHLTPRKHPQLRVRDGRSRLIPYFEFDFSVPPHAARVGHLRVGPTPHADLAIDGVCYALDANGLSYQSCGRSNTPYREW